MFIKKIQERKNKGIQYVTTFIHLIKTCGVHRRQFLSVFKKSYQIQLNLCVTFSVGTKTGKIINLER